MYKLEDKKVMAEKEIVLRKLIDSRKTARDCLILLFRLRENCNTFKYADDELKKDPSIIRKYQTDQGIYTETLAQESEKLYQSLEPMIPIFFKLKSTLMHTVLRDKDIEQKLRWNGDQNYTSILKQMVVNYIHLITMLEGLHIGIIHGMYDKEFKGGY